MNFLSLLKNRTVLGVICIVLSLIVCFALTPLFNQSVSKKTSIVRVVKDIKTGDQITGDMVQTVEVGGYNLPETILKQADSAVGKYAAADLSPGDYILSAKLTDVPAAENAYLYNLNGDKQAISVSIKSLAQGLSGKLTSGDIVSVIAPDYKKQGSTVIPPELTYVEVIGVTASTGYDTGSEQSSGNTGNGKTEEEKELPATVTLLASPEQAKILAGLETEGKLHLSLVYRGSKENAAKFTGLQDKVIEALYPRPVQGQSNGNTTGSSSAGAADAAAPSKSSADSKNTAAESGGR